MRWSGALAPGSCANIPQRNAVWIFSGGSSGGWAHGHKQTCGTYGLKSRGSLCVLLRKPSNICGFLDDTFHFMALSTVQHFNRICPVNFPICWERPRLLPPPSRWRPPWAWVWRRCFPPTVTKDFCFLCADLGSSPYNVKCIKATVTVIWHRRIIKYRC